MANLHNPDEMKAFVKEAIKNLPATPPRNPKRIHAICMLLKQYWLQHPDMRLGQIVVNMIGSSDPFYAEDHVALKALKKALKEEANDGRK